MSRRFDSTHFRFRTPDKSAGASKRNAGSICGVSRAMLHALHEERERPPSDICRARRSRRFKSPGMAPGMAEPLRTLAEAAVEAHASNDPLDRQPECLDHA